MYVFPYGPKFAGSPVVKVVIEQSSRKKGERESVREGERALSDPPEPQQWPTGGTKLQRCVGKHATKVRCHRPRRTDARPRSKKRWQA